MAVSLKDPQDGDIPEVSEINVTPFIDVILVLLIIFMVAPRSRRSTSPSICRLECTTAASTGRAGLPEVKPDLSLALGNEPVPRELLCSRPDTGTPLL